ADSGRTPTGLESGTARTTPVVLADGDPGISTDCSLPWRASKVPTVTDTIKTSPSAAAPTKGKRRPTRAAGKGKTSVGALTGVALGTLALKGWQSTRMPMRGAGFPVCEHTLVLDMR